MEKTVAFIDCEVGNNDHKIKDFGATDEGGRQLHSHFVADFEHFIAQKEFVCGHNILHHDLKYILPLLSQPLNAKFIDTLYWSPLLFPKNPYHALLKDDKLRTDELNNPLNDAHKAQDLFWDEVQAFNSLPPRRKTIYYLLLVTCNEFSGLFHFVDFKPTDLDLPELINAEFEGEICANANLTYLIDRQPIELAYALALIGTFCKNSITPPWLLRNYPGIENVVRLLRETPCNSCDYCQNKLDVVRGLKKFFGYDQFRTFDGEPLQEDAARAAVAGKSLLAIFPTGGGKSITFQLPALMAGELMHGLTVIISPLQSLMKDQVDNLSSRGFTDAVTINGMISVVERKDAIERVANGGANLLYISPEQLRSNTIMTLLLKRNVVRFVIDEAHCFSAWGQDFRVDYLYIGDFIKEYQKSKLSSSPIAISCFTATAKQKVIYDIKDYFQRKLDVSLQLFATSATRKNLHYTVLHRESDNEKYNELRRLIADKNCPTIVYVSRTRRTIDLAEKLTKDGFPALPYNGKMDSNEKIANQEAFISGKTDIMVATSAFGMGVDKSDVGLVIHYDISDSLENYVQEAGRAGRDQSLEAECYVLFNDADLDKHFILLNQTKLSISQIQQVWSAMKRLTKNRPTVCCSALEIAREAGWNDTVSDIETRIRTAINALENAGYVKRGKNVPHVYATSIVVKNMEEAVLKIDASKNYDDDDQRTNAKRVIKSLISSKNTAEMKETEAESRIDYLADVLGIKRYDVIKSVNTMRQDGILADHTDMTAIIPKNETAKWTSMQLERFLEIENFLLPIIGGEEQTLYLKELNEAAEKRGIKKCSVKNIRTIFYFLTIKEYIKKEEHMHEQSTTVVPLISPDDMMKKFAKRAELCRYIVKLLFGKVQTATAENNVCTISFSLFEILKGFNNRTDRDLFSQNITATQNDVEDALLYLQKIGAMKLEGGFLVIYNQMQVERLVLENSKRYTKEDYKQLNDYYKQKIQQIHIVGEYANLMVRDEKAALKFVHDYFNMEFKNFISLYFKGERKAEIENNITPAKYKQLFGDLSETQTAVINDKESKRIVVAAGPGSGKTKVLVHKLASLLLLEDVKHEQLLMLTFSRAAATEFKKRLVALVDNAANFVQIKTFHSYSFDIMGRIGNIEDSKNIVADAAKMIENGEVESGDIIKSVLVIDEAQDMDADEFALVQALMKHNEDLRVIAVGDDDQNIYEFRGSDSRHMQQLLSEPDAHRYELTENFRSRQDIVALANAFAASISSRLKTQPGIAINSSRGNVSITSHVSSHLEEPVLNHIVANNYSGTTCILTQKNEEAANMVGLLTRHGIRAKLIQSVEKFSICNTMELRHFAKTIENGLHGSKKIATDLWQAAKDKLREEYSNSSCFDICQRLIAEFEAVNTYDKYWNDFKEFIVESNLEDFSTAEQGTIFVSTIHKAKGREFDNVYLLLDHPDIATDEAKRRIYVAITRTKQNLHIHCNNSVFSAYQAEGSQHLSDFKLYAPPAEIALQMGFRDVYLDFFKDKKDKILKLRSGNTLEVEGNGLFAEIDGEKTEVLRFSKACKEKIDRYTASGYHTTHATINFIVAWRGENDTHESAVILPTISMKKSL